MTSCIIEPYTLKSQNPRTYIQGSINLKSQPSLQAWRLPPSVSMTLHICPSALLGARTGWLTETQDPRTNPPHPQQEQTDRQTDTPTDGQTARQTDSQTDRDRQTLANKQVDGRKERHINQTDANKQTARKTNRDRQKQTETERQTDTNRQKDTDGHKQTDTNKQTQTDRQTQTNRNRQTDTDRQTQTETETETETDTDTDTNTDRQTASQPARQTNRKKRYIYIYICYSPLLYPRFVLEMSGIVVVSLQSFPISTILGHT